MSAPRERPGSNFDTIKARTPYQDDQDEPASTLRSVLKQDPDLLIDPRDMNKVGSLPNEGSGEMVSLCFMALAVSFGSSVFSTAMVLTAKEFKVSPQYMLLGLSLYVFGIACGTLVFGSRTSDAIRSRNSIAVCMVVSIVCHLVVGLAFNLRTVLAGRYLAGFFASVPIAVAPRAAFDICDSAERATAIVALVLSLSLGPILGVIGGEFALLIPGSNWRWTIWTAAITSALSVFFALVGSPPTSRPPVRATTQGAQQQPNGQVKNSHLMSKDASARLAAGTGSQRSQGALRSAERIVIGMCGILVYGLLHMLLLVYPMNFEIHRAFPFGISSLPFLAVVAGLMLGGLRLVRQSRLGEDKAWITSPEHSLSATASGIYTLSTGLFIFAWTSHRDTSPWPQISSGVLIGYGIMAVLAPALVCLVDESSADMFGLSIYAFLQSVTASVAPLLVIPMYQKLGVRTASNSLATLCLVVALLFSLYLRQSRR